MTDKTIVNPQSATSAISGGEGLADTMATVRVSAGQHPADPSQTLRTTQQQTDDSALVDENKDFDLKGVIYRNLECLSDNSGEAQVFLVERDEKPYVLKVYYPNFDVNKKLLQVIRSFEFEMIVKLYDFGKTYVDGKHRYYELMEYLSGGTLSNYHLNGDMDQFRRIALQGAAALSYCHNFNILHKDIKPSNFFFRNSDHEQLVLGDFGISSMLENDGKSHRTSQARTPIYAAPEMYSDVIDGVVEITPAADFYSLGITLFALWIGDNPLSSNERVMMRQKSEGRLPRLNELPDKVRIIVQGLTAVNPQSRWGYDEVERWFKGEDVQVDLSSPFLKYKSFIVDPDRNLVADNVHELIPLLLDNERLAIGYLYNGRINQWLESCGNQKLATAVKDIVVNRYPADQHAGLMSCIYTMEPTQPYKDIRGTLCDDIHAIAISVLSYLDQYGLLLKNPNDNLFLYLETHSKCDVNRLRSYFADLDSAKPEEIRNAVIKMVYEMDPEIPFLPKFPSATISQIVHAFGYGTPSEDDWRSLTDGRLLAWMHSHEDVMACESLRIMTKDQPFSKTLAYKVLYNIDRDAAYDLRTADTPEKVGQLLKDRLKDSQHLSLEDFKKEMEDFTDPDGRFVYFAQLHGWMSELAAANHCFDMKSEENRERLSAYDIPTAVYRFCCMLGVTPSYVLADGTELTDDLQLSPNLNVQIRPEMSNGYFTQWLSIFYHENPNADFSEDYSYEHSLENWVMKLGTFDKNQHYYKRLVAAREETDSKMTAVKNGWQNAKRKEKTWRYLFYGLSALWMLLVLVFGVPKDVAGITGRDFLLRHSFITIGIPLGGMTLLIAALRAYFRGYGFVLSVLWGLLGALSCIIPIQILKYRNANMPGMFNIAIVVMTLVYMLICHLTDFRGDQKADNKLINEVFDDDIKSTLLEPLYYTFKTKSFKYKGSKFAVLDDVTDQVRSISGESVIHYILWSTLIAVMLAEFVIFSPSLLNVRNPYLDNNWKLQPHKVIKQLEKDVE